MDDLTSSDWWSAFFVGFVVGAGLFLMFLNAVAPDVFVDTLTPKIKQD